MTQYYIIDGWVSKEQLIANGTRIQDLPLAADMTHGRVWLSFPKEESELIVPAKIVDTISGHRFAYGGYTFTWVLQNMSPKMTKYIRDTYLNGGWSGNVTVQTYNRQTGEFEAYQAIAKYPNVREDAEMGAGGFTSLKLTFVNAVSAPDGPDLTITPTNPNNWEYQSNSVYTMVVDNDGDGNTFDTVQVVLALDTKTDYVSSSHSGWTIEYSTNSGGSYSSTPPGDLTTITHLRYSRSDELLAGASYGSIATTLTTNDTGLAGLTATVTTAGDTNNANDSVTTNFNIEFDVTDLAGSVNWIDANDTVEIFTTSGATVNVANDSDTVGYINDKASTPHDFSQVTAGNRPLWRTGILNGLPVIRFDGTDDYLTATNLGIGGTSDFTIIGVVKGTTADSSVWYWAGSTTDADTDIRNIASDGSGDDSFTRTSDIGGADTVTLANTTADTGSFYVRVHRKTGDTYLNRVNQVDQTTTKTFTNSVTTNTTVLGARNNGGTLADYFDGDVAEIIVYSNSISDANVILIEKYLSGKWGITY